MARKPLRRTAWGMLLGGLLAAALMMGAGVVLVMQGASAGPGAVATWPAHTEVTLYRQPFVYHDEDDLSSVRCVVTEGGTETREQLAVSRPQPPRDTEAMLSCDQKVRLLTGGAITAAGAFRGPLITLPLFVAGLGVFFFFPRTTAWLASSPTNRWVRKRRGLPPVRPPWE